MAAAWRFGAALVACLSLIAAGEAPNAVAFDPPFLFPALHAAGKAVPTEQNFTKACFSYVYGLLRSGKPTKLEKRPSDMPKVMMANCLQADKKGCERFAKQLQGIVEAKQKEGPIGHMRAANKAAAKAVVPPAKPVAAAAAAPPKAQVGKAKPAAAASAPAAKKVHHRRKPGARVKAEDRDDSFLQVEAEEHPSDTDSAFAQDFANFGLAADGAAAPASPAASEPAAATGLGKDFALLGVPEAAPEKAPVVAKKPADEKNVGLLAMKRPLRYSDWCTHLYAVATAASSPVEVATPAPKPAPEAPKKVAAAAHKKVPEAANVSKAPAANVKVTATNVTKTANVTKNANLTKKA